jgi:hypothetical protein
MAYEKTLWKDRQGAGLNRYTKSGETGASVYLSNTPDSVTERGTDFSAENMNHIEQGISDAHEAAAALDGKIDESARLLTESDNALGGRIDGVNTALQGFMDGVMESIQDHQTLATVSRADLIGGVSNLPTGVIYICNDDVGNGVEFRSMFIGGENGKALEVFRRTLTPPPVLAPSASPGGGYYEAAQNVTLTCPTPGAKIYYTVNGGEPKTSGVLYAGQITISQTARLRAAATLNSVWSPELDITYDIQTQVATPTASHEGGIYFTPISVTLTCETSGAQIRYTLDGSGPTASSPLYSDPVNVNASLTLKAKAFKAGMADSDILTEIYTLESGTPGMEGYYAFKSWFIQNATYNGDGYYSMTTDELGLGMASAVLEYMANGWLYMYPVSDVVFITFIS